MADGRYFGPSDVDDRWLSSLTLVDPVTRTELAIDDHVFLNSVGRRPPDDDGLVTYSVSDGERSGIYLARLPPTDRSAPTAAPGEPPPLFDVLPGPHGRPELRLREGAPLTPPAAP